MMGLTAKQRELYDFIAAYLAENGYAPSFGEMAAAIGLASKGRIGELLEALAERGHVRRLPNRVRAIEIIPPPPPVTCPPALVRLNSEIATLTDRYAKEHGISRDTAANELLRQALGAAA